MKHVTPPCNRSTSGQHAWEPWGGWPTAAEAYADPARWVYLTCRLCGAHDRWPRVKAYAIAHDAWTADPLRPNE